MRSFRLGEDFKVFTPYGRTPLKEAWSKKLRIAGTDFIVGLHRKKSVFRHVILEEGGRTVLFQLDPEIVLSTSRGKTKVRYLLKGDEVKYYGTGDGEEKLNNEIKEARLRERFCKVVKVFDSQETKHFEIKGTDIKPVTIYKEGIYLNLY